MEKYIICIPIVLIFLATSFLIHAINSHDIVWRINSILFSIICLGMAIIIFIQFANDYF